MLGAKAAAQYLGISKSSIFRLVENGELTCCRIGSRVVFKKEWLDEFIENHKINGGLN